MFGLNLKIVHIDSVLQVKIYSIVRNVLIPFFEMKFCMGNNSFYVI